MSSKVSYRGDVNKGDAHLYHGVNSYVTINFQNEEPSAEVDVIFVEKIELNRSVDTVTETYVGLYGEPSFNAPTRVEYFGTMRKKVSEEIKHRGGREEEQMSIEKYRSEEAGFFTNSILNFNDGGIKGAGIFLRWDLKIYTLVKKERMITIAEDCTLTSHKRVIDKANFVYDEYTFKFTRFNQKIINRF